MVRVQCLFAVAPLLPFASANDPVNICKVADDWKPEAKVQDSNLGGGSYSCSQVVGSFFNDFAPSENACLARKEMGFLQVPSGSVMAMMRPDCCKNGAGKESADVCAEHMGNPNQICKDTAQFLPDAIAMGEDSPDKSSCHDSVMYYFPERFTASVDSCAEERDVGGGNTQTPSMMMSTVSARCCGGTKNVCEDFGPKLCASEDDFVATLTVKHGNLDVSCTTVQGFIGVAGTATKEKCAADVTAGALTEKRRVFTEKYKAACCGGKASVCTQFEAQAGKKDSLESSQTENADGKTDNKADDQGTDANSVRCAAVAAPLAITAALAF